MKVIIEIFHRSYWGGDSAPCFIAKKAFDLSEEIKLFNAINRNSSESDVNAFLKHLIDKELVEKRESLECEIYSHGNSLLSIAEKE